MASTAAYNLWDNHHSPIANFNFNLTVIRLQQLNYSSAQACKMLLYDRPANSHSDSNEFVSGNLHSTNAMFDQLDLITTRLQFERFYSVMSPGAAAVVFILKTTAIWSLGHRSSTLTAVLRLSSTFDGMLKRVLTFGLSNNITNSNCGKTLNISWLAWFECLWLLRTILHSLNGLD